MKVPYINLKGQHAAIRKEILSALSRVFRDSDFILGKEVRTLEKRFARYCGTRFAVGVNSGTDALFLAMKSLGIGQGDEVITTPNTFLATATSIVAAGARPVFIDVRDDMNIDPGLIEAKVTDRTKAIMPVHLTGKPTDMNSILDIARRRGLHVIEDAAQAIGTEYHGKRAGSFGIVNAFSLHPLKTLNASGDGGMITTNDDSIYEKCRQLRNIGLKNRSESELWGYNSRLDSIQAAIVNLKFKNLDRWIAQRRRNAAYYRERLSPVVWVPEEREFEKCAYHIFVIQAERRDALREYLSKNGIETKIHYPIPIHLQKCAADLGYKRGDFPVTERQSEIILSLPVYQSLTQKDLKYVADKILKFYKS